MVAVAMVTAARRGRRGPEAGLGHHEENNEGDQHRQEHPALLELLAQRRDLGRRPGVRTRWWRSGWRTTGREMDHLLGIPSLDSDGERDRNRVQDDCANEPAVGRDRQVPAGDQDQRDAGDALDDRPGNDDAALDELAQRNREGPVLRTHLALTRDHREQEHGAEDHDRAQDVQEEEQLEQVGHLLVFAPRARPVRDGRRAAQQCTLRALPA